MLLLFIMPKAGDEYDDLSFSQQAGNAIARVLRDLTFSGCRVSDVFDMIRPHVDFTFDNVLSHINTIFVLKTHKAMEPIQDGPDVTRLENTGQVQVVILNPHSRAGNPRLHFPIRQS